MFCYIHTLERRRRVVLKTAISKSALEDNATYDENDIVWFNANEIALTLGYKFPIINNVDKEDKIKLEDININNKINKHPHSIYIYK